MGKADKTLWEEIRMCDHIEFEARVRVTRITNGPSDSFMGDLGVDVEAYCIECEQPVTFIGLPMGVDVDRPAVSVDHRSARLPARIRLS